MPSCSRKIFVQACYILSNVLSYNWLRIICFVFVLLFVLAVLGLVRSTVTVIASATPCLCMLDPISLGTPHGRQGTSSQPQLLNRQTSEGGAEGVAKSGSREGNIKKGGKEKLAL